MLKILLCTSLLILFFTQVPSVMAVTSDLVAYADSSPSAIWLFGSVILGFFAANKKTDS